MRCIGSEGVDLSQLSLQHDSALHDPSSITMTNVTNSKPDVAISAFPALETHDASTQNSLQLSPTSIRSDSDLTNKSCLNEASFACRRYIHPQQISSLSSPQLNVSPGISNKQNYTGTGVSSSLHVCCDSESDCSCASTTKNTLSSESSLNTVPGDLAKRQSECPCSSTAKNSVSSEGSLNTAPIDQAKFPQSDLKDREDNGKEPDLQNGKVSSHSSRAVQKQRPSPDKETKTGVQLPERYRHALQKSVSYASVGSQGVSKNSCCGSGQDITSREKDLGTALAWIRHEMVQMKEQDKVLLKRFIELRANILQLRCMYDVLGSNSDVSSMDGSSASLNEMRKPARLRSTESDAMLSGRLYMAPSSLSLPCSPQMSRLRWRSDELM